MPRIVILSDLSRAYAEDLEEWKSDMFRQRHAWWRRLAELTGWDLQVHDTAEVLRSSALLQGARVCFIDMPLLRQSAYRVLFDYCSAHAPDAAVCDPPAAVNRVQWLNEYYPALIEHGLPCIRTAVVPLGDDVIDSVQSPDDVQARLGETLQRALTDANLDLRRGLYIRTFLASLRNTHPAFYFAHTPKELHGTCFRVLQMMRGKNDVGGLALREFVSLEAIDLPADAPGVASVQVHHEMRLTLLGGRLLMASFHGPFLQLSPGQQDQLRQVLSARGNRLSALAEIARRLGQAGLPDNYVADVAFLGSGQPVLIELNPLYSAGSNVPAARAWLIANLGARLAERAGYSPTADERLRELAGQLAGEPLRSDGVFVFGADFEGEIARLPARG